MKPPKIPKSLVSLINVYQQPFVLVDKAFTIVAANQQYAEQFGCNPDEIIGRKCHQVSHNSDHPCAEHGEDCPHLRMFKSGQVEEALHIHTRQDGTKDCVEIRAHPILGDDGEIQYMGELLTPVDNEESMRKNELVGSSPLFLEAVREAGLLASSDLPVLITGESGVGKERFSHYVHARSLRGKGPFITLDCCGLSETLFESELFGHEAGSFTDAQKKKTGLFELADEGTLFLDEVGEISPTLQAKLLRVIETGTYRRVGGTQTLQANVRIVSATNCDLSDMVKQGTFRRDLYYRLAGHTLYLPALRERSGDISQLLCHFLQHQRHKTAPTAEALRLLEQYNYPGNIRELKYIVELASLKAGMGNITPEHLPLCVREYSISTQQLSDTYSTDPRSCKNDHQVGRRKEDRQIMGMDANEVLEILGKVKGSRRQAAKELGISERKIYRLIKKYEEAGFEIPPPYL